MKTSARRIASVVSLVGLMCSVIGWGAADTASASPRAPFTCSGTLKDPGILKGGTYAGNVLVSGVCFVNSGQAVVDGNLTVEPKGALDATFALDDPIKSGYSNLTVKGNLFVGKGATAGLGCNPMQSACTDDPTPKTPTLSSWDWIGGNLVAVSPLGVIVHSSFIGKNVTEAGGGGGLTCKPEGIFVALKSPVFSDYENTVIGGSLSITGLHTCWLGAISVTVRGNVLDKNNKMADPDADEVNTNNVNGSLTCLSNVPAVQFGDSGGAPNVVKGVAAGECGFKVMVPNPGGKHPGPLQHISVRPSA